MTLSLQARNIFIKIYAAIIFVIINERFAFHFS